MSEETAQQGERKAIRLDETPVEDPKTKIAKTTVRALEEVMVGHNDLVGAEEDWSMFPLEEESESEDVEGRTEGEGPPTVSQEKLDELDAIAALEEIEKLNQMKVIEPLEMDPREIPSECLVDTTVAKDWRYRQGWKRRCRIVAREYRMNQNTDENTHSPTSAFAAVRILLILGMIYDLAVTALDIKDAFLVVPQPEDEPMFVLIPEWIQALQPECKHNIWRLRRCLPGQRSAAQHWFAFFTGLCKKAGMVSFPGCPTVLKLVDKDHHIYLTVHVDDVLLVCNDKDLKWFQKNVAKELTTKVDGPHQQGSGKTMMYLKKRITFLDEGTLIQPNNTYIPKLIELLKLAGRRKKGLPHHSTLDAYHPDQPGLDELTEEEVKSFRSALGLILYISHDRPDISFATKVLSTWMARPCGKAMAGVKHLALYLSGTEHGGVLLRRCEEHENVFDRWIESGDWMEFDTKKQKTKSTLNLDVFADSSWGDDRGTRKSTSSSTVFLNGAYVLGFSRTQATVALSSCEAELYAANAAVAKGCS